MKMLAVLLLFIVAFMGCSVSGSNQTCEICIEVMTHLKDLRANNETLTGEEIIEQLEQVCNNLPSQTASECNAIISEYGQAILELNTEEDAHNLCKAIGLCSSAQKKKRALKKKRDFLCFLGAFWCAKK